MTTTDHRQSGHEAIVEDLILLIEHDDELKRLLLKSIEQAHELNPDPDSNPVDSLESYYDFLDHSYKAMPWAITKDGNYHKLYDLIDQSMGCFYFVCDQPLQELKDKGYYHNSLMYHEPFRSWLIRFMSQYGFYLNEEISWNEEYYKNALQNPDFHLDDDTYEDPSNWKCFNDFFARRLKDPSRRPIASPQDPSVIVFPADSVPQGPWSIDPDHKIVMDDELMSHGIAIKTGILKDVSSLLLNSAYRDCFGNGVMTHTLLDVNDYHRYHFPADGTVKEIYAIPADDAPGGIITWDPDIKRYVEHFSESYSWQSLETRAVIILELDHGGLMAIVPIGMCEVSSVNFEDDIKVGSKVRKGDPMGYFLFGGSDIVLLFSEDAGFEMTCEAGKHALTGEEYGRLK